MSTSFGISKKVPFTENMPSLVISNSHQKSWKKWKSHVESKLESNIFYSKKKKKRKMKESIHFRVYTAFNCPISLGSFSQKCFFNLSLTFTILILLKTQLITLWNILQFGYVCAWQEYHQRVAVFKWHSVLICPITYDVPFHHLIKIVSSRLLSLQWS